jgi:pyridoxamine 5'-phosphate oxidase-like protein
MPTQQGDLSLLNDPVAQQLLRSTIPARLAYNWTDGTPRIVPIWFHWNGKEIVLAGPPDAPKMRALRDGTKVAVTIDSESFPAKVLQIRGTVRVDMADGVAPEYAAAAERYLGEEQGRAWAEQVRGLFTQMGRIFIQPEWVAILDFETRFPNAMERAMEWAQAASA